MSPLERIAELLRREAHIEAALAAPSAIAALVHERQRALRINGQEEYATLVEGSPAELARLREQIAVPETWLFRYPAAFELLRARLMRRPDRPFRALSLACATGAEPLAIAATALAAGVPAASIRVVGIDPNATALERARTGELSRLAMREPLPEWAKEYFIVAADGIRANDALRACLTLEVGAAPEALEHLENGSFDVIFCRNLAIYLGHRPRLRIGARLAELLAADGLLFLGHAEPPSIFGLGDRFVSACQAQSGSFAHDRAETETDCFERAPAKASAATRARDKTAGPRPAAPAQRSSAAARPAQSPATRPAHASAATPATASPPALIAQARAHADAGRLADALEIASQLHHAGDRSAELLELLGSIHAARGDHARAESLLRQVVYLLPRHTEALMRLASLADSRGDPDQARRYRERASKESA